MDELLLADQSALLLPTPMRVSEGKCPDGRPCVEVILDNEVDDREETSLGVEEVIRLRDWLTSWLKSCGS
jgi:hypothetical protein